jgi:hypothetical protein
MLVRLFEHEISNNWEIIKENLIDVLGPNIDYSIILAKLNNGELQAWFIQDKENGKVENLGVLVTAIAYEPITNEKNLIALSINSFNYIPVNVWQDSIKTILKWAKIQKIKNLVSYTNNPRVIQMLGSFGANIETRLIKIGVI